jgi:hypothetical protein
LAFLRFETRLNPAIEMLFTNPTHTTYFAVCFVDLILLEYVSRDKTDEESEYWKRHSDDTQLLKTDSKIDNGIASD